MCEHVRYRCPLPTNEGDAQIGRRRKDDVSPSATDPSKPIPPTFALAFPKPRTTTFLEKNRRPAVVEDAEQRIIVKDIDECASSIDAAMGHKQMPMNMHRRTAHTSSGLFHRIERGWWSKNRETCEGTTYR